MSVQAMTWAYKQNIKPAGLKFILVTLANYASEDLFCYPSQRKLGALTGQSLRAVNAHLATLEERGYIVRAHRFRDDGGQTSDGFYLQTAPAESAPPPMQNLHTPPAESAPNTKEYPKDEQKEEGRAPAQRFAEQMETLGSERAAWLSRHGIVDYPTWCATLHLPLGETAAHTWARATRRLKQ